jgi:hypothetical protein
MRIGVALLALAAGGTLVIGADSRALLIGIGVLVIGFAAAVLWERIVAICLSIWALGWVALVGGVAGPDLILLLGGAIAVLGGGVAFATSNYATWFGVATLGVAVALVAVAIGTGGTLAGWACAGLAAGSLALGASMLLAKTEGTPHRTAHDQPDR